MFYYNKFNALRKEIHSSIQSVGKRFNLRHENARLQARKKFYDWTKL